MTLNGGCCWRNIVCRVYSTGSRSPVISNAKALKGDGQVILITPEGQALRRKMWPVYAEAIHEAIGTRLSPAEAYALDRLLSRLIQ